MKITTYIEFLQTSIHFDSEKPFTSIFVPVLRCHHFTENFSEKWTHFRSEDQKKRVKVRLKY
jgi:hypothetical protein